MKNGIVYFKIFNLTFTKNLTIMSRKVNTMIDDATLTTICLSTYENVCLTYLKSLYLSIKYNENKILKILLIDVGLFEINPV